MGLGSGFLAGALARPQPHGKRGPNLPGGPLAGEPPAGDRFPQPFQGHHKLAQLSQLGADLQVIAAQPRSFTPEPLLGGPYISRHWHHGYRRDRAAVPVRAEAHRYDQAVVAFPELVVDHKD